MNRYVLKTFTVHKANENLQNVLHPEQTVVDIVEIVGSVSSYFSLSELFVYVFLQNHNNHTKAFFVAEKILN